MAQGDTATSPILDPGWLFLAAGLTVLGAAVVIPAYEDLAEARFRKERAIAVERHRESRIARYEEFLGAVQSREPQLIESLAATQLNQIPTSRAALPVANRSGIGNASVFPSLEPEPLVLPEREHTPTRLEKLVTDEKSRKWVVVAGAVCVLIGLLPAARRREQIQSA